MSDDTDDNKGRWYGKEFCPHPGERCIDGCYYCGRDVGDRSGEHDHTKVSRQGEPDEYGCVCKTC